MFPVALCPLAATTDCGEFANWSVFEATVPGLSNIRLEKFRPFNGNSVSVRVLMLLPTVASVDISIAVPPEVTVTTE